MEFPKITVGIVHSRDGMTIYGESWLDKAVSSVKKQLCPSEIDLIVIENMDHKKSIGKCYNEITDQAKGEWVFFLGDDDYIKPEYLTSLISWVMELQLSGAEPAESYVQVSGYCMAFSTDIIKGETLKVPLQRIPQGMWLRSYLLENKFDETLEKYVDTELYGRADEDPDVSLVVVDWNFGYYYRQHDGEFANVSGNKLKEYIEQNEGVMPDAD